jgi:amidase
MAMPDARDPWWVPAPHEHGDERSPCRVAVLAKLDGVPADPAMTEHIRRAPGWLADAGYVVEEITPPRFLECAELWQSLLQNETRMGLIANVEQFGDAGVRHAAKIGLAITEELDFRSYMKALARRATYLREWLVFIERYPDGGGTSRQKADTTIRSRLFNAFTNSL